MKKVIFLLSLLFAASLLTAEPLKYSRIEVQTDISRIQDMLLAGVNLDQAYFSGEGLLIIEASDQEMQILLENNFSFKVLIEDLSAYYVNRNFLPESQVDLHTRSPLNQTYPVPAGFSLGSHGGFCTYNEYHAHLDNLHDTYPEFISPKTALPTLSVEGRPIYYVRIANDNVPGDKPKVLYTGMIHAREPIGMQHLLFFMYYIMENYDSDPAIQYLVDHAELYLVPMVNPDGYLYNMQTNPNGGGMWRKNRKSNVGGSFGIDLNRNFGYMWGYDNTGSSPTPSSDTYRGTGPFSEPETQAIRDLCIEIPFTNALNYHSYSNLLLYNWGYIASTCPDDNTYRRHGRILTSDNGYAYGAASLMLYTVNGGSDDWMYGDQILKPKIFAYTPEVGSTDDGFWPAVNRIIPQCQENMYQSLMAGLLSLQYAEANMVNLPVTRKLNNYFVFEIERLGFQDGAEFTVSIEPLNNYVVSTGDPVILQNPGLFGKVTDSIYFQLDPAITGGTPLDFILSVDNGHYMKSDTVRIWFGIKQTAWYDPCSSLLGWTGNWGLSNIHYVSPPSSLTDSPSGNYPSSGTRTITTATAVQVPSAAAVYLKFDARWLINGNGAYVQARISNNGGSTWSPLKGKYTRPGLFSAVAGLPVYNDSQPDWVTEMIDISSYAGQNVLIRFHLYSSSWGIPTADGFYFDDIEIITVPYTTPVNAMFEAGDTIVLQGTEVAFSDLSAGSPNNWQWVFEGGQPLESALQNPVVLYSGPGTYDVQLTASNALDTDVILASAYILVLDSILCKPEVFAGNDTIILPWETYTAITANAENYQALLWSTSGDGYFDDETILQTTYTPGNNDKLNQHVFLTLTGFPVYDVCQPGTHTLDLSIVDYTGIDPGNHEMVNIFPNPAQNFIRISFAGIPGKGLLELFTMTGEKLISMQTAQNAVQYLDLSDFNNGVYLLRYAVGDQITVRKVVIVK